MTDPRIPRPARQPGAAGQHPGPGADLQAPAGGAGTATHQRIPKRRRPVARPFGVPGRRQLVEPLGHRPGTRRRPGRRVEGDGASQPLGFLGVGPHRLPRRGGNDPPEPPDHRHRAAGPHPSPGPRARARPFISTPSASPAALSMARIETYGDALPRATMLRGQGRGREVVGHLPVQTMDDSRCPVARLEQAPARLQPSEPGVVLRSLSAVQFLCPSCVSRAAAGG
jgi:hypothetical protein